MRIAGSWTCGIDANAHVLLHFQRRSGLVLKPPWFRLTHPVIHEYFQKRVEKTIQRQHASSGKRTICSLMGEYPPPAML